MAEIKISYDDLKDPAIDDVLNLQRSVAPQAGQHVDEIKTPFYLNPIFYYTLSSAIGAVAVWAVTEPFLNDDKGKGAFFISDYLLFGPVAGMLGLSIGAIYGIVNRNVRKTLYCGLVGAGVGLAATILTTFIAEIVFNISLSIVVSMLRDQPKPEPGKYPIHGVAFFALMCGRGVAWSIVSMAAGLGLGIALKSKKLMLNGFVGGMIGGMLGGLIFDPIGRFITHETDGAMLSRFIGILAVGSLVGFFTGLFENISKEAWFLMLKGPLQGKQFILFKSPMQIGSSPKSEIYIFKDPDVAPKHASITKSGSKYVLKDEGSDKGTFVNGRRVDRYILQPADTITIGEAVFRYAEKAKGN